MVVDDRNRAAKRAARRVPQRAAITVRPSPLDPSQGLLRLGPLTVRCALGRSGVTARKREGDGATPRGDHAVLSAFVRRERWGMPPRGALSMQAIGAEDGWCDAPEDPSYNRPVSLPHRASAEAMSREDQLYDAVVVLDYNMTRRVRGVGSAIFFHVARAGYAPTEGCIAVSHRDMRRLLPHLARGRIVRVL